MEGATIGTPHRRRLRQIWRSAGWPCCDGVEIELIAAGLVERQCDAAGRETLRVTDSGVRLLAQTLAANRATLGPHEALVAKVAREMARAGRIVWTRLALRAKVADAWVVAKPDVFSIRSTSVEAYVEPIVHEIKVHRADLLADLRREAKGAAYCKLGGQCWYVLREGIGDASEVPDAYGVMVERAASLLELRPAPKRVASMTFSLWMSLARASPLALEDESQTWLGDSAQDSAESCR